MLNKIVSGQLKQGLREGNSQRLAIAIIGFGLVVFIRLVRGADKQTVYSRQLKAGESLQLRLRERP